jgi:hypothetical protein
MGLIPLSLSLSVMNILMETVPPLSFAHVKDNAWSTLHNEPKVFFVVPSDLFTKQSLKITEGEDDVRNAWI